MGTWSIEPNNPEYVTDKGDGNYIFKPQSEDITYTITYTDDNGATGKTIYVVKSTDCYVDPCQNDFEGPVVTFLDGTTSTTVSNEAGNIAVQYNLGDCWEFVSVGKYKEPNNITSFKYDDGKIIYYSANTSLEYVPSEAVYKFKNTKANIVTSSYVKINQESKCSSTDCPVIEAPTTHTLPKDGGTVNVNFNADDCWTLTKSLDKPGSVASFVSEKQIKVEANPTSESRTITASYIFINQYSQTTCNTQNVVITQEKGCSCDDVTYEVVKSSFTHEGGSAKIGNLTTCDRDKTSIEVKSGSSYITSGPAIAQEPQSGVYPVSITVKSNETRDTTYHVKYVINFNGQQCKPGESETPPYYDLIIEPKGCTCDCNYLKRIDKDKPYFFPTKDTNPGRPTLTNQILKELVMKDGFSSHCTYEDLEPYAIDTGITRIWTAVTGNILEIRGDIADITKEGEYKRALRFGLKVCGNDCNILKPPFYIFQRCYCGTDDCRNVYNIEGGGTVVEDHPMYMGGCVENGWPSGWSHPFPKYPEGKYHGDADSVFVDSLYVVPMKPVNGVLQPMYATANNPEGKVKLFHTVNGEFIADGSTFYWPDHRTTDKPVLVTYNEQGYPLGISIDVNTERPMIGVASLIGAKTASTSSVTITYDKDGNTENVQMYTWLDDETKSLISENTKWEVLLATDEDETVAGPNPHTDCCKEFITTIYQAKKDYFYNKDHREDDMARLDPCTY